MDNDCISPVYEHSINDHQDYVTVPLTEPCPHVDQLPVSLYWTDVECKPATFSLLESSTQIKHYGREVRVYCPDKNDKYIWQEYPCPDFPFMLNANVSFETETIKYEYKETRLNAPGMRFDQKLNDLASTVFLSRVSKIDLTQSFDKTRRLIESLQTTPTYKLSMIDFKMYATLGGLLIVLMILICASLGYLAQIKSARSYRKKKSQKQAPAPESDYEIPLSSAPPLPDRSIKGSPRT